FQPGGGTHHVRQATRTAVSYRTHPPRCPAELVFDGGNVAFGHGSVGVPRDGLICASHDRSSIVRWSAPPRHRRNGAPERGSVGVRTRIVGLLDGAPQLAEP